MSWTDRYQSIRLRGGWPSRLGDVLPQTIGKIGPAGLLAEAKVRRAWPEAVGEQVAGHATVHRLRNGVLEVAVTTDSWANELRYLAETIRDRLNVVCGRGTVTGVVIRKDRVRRG